ncbi:MAG: hypothetical protein AAF515_05170 [Pseudomonadota bacterium]
MNGLKPRDRAVADLADSKVVRKRWAAICAVVHDNWGPQVRKGGDFDPDDGDVLGFWASDLSQLTEAQFARGLAWLRDTPGIDGKYVPNRNHFRNACRPSDDWKHSHVEQVGREDEERRRDHANYLARVPRHVIDRAAARSIAECRRALGMRRAHQ